MVSGAGSAKAMAANLQFLGSVASPLLSRCFVVVSSAATSRVICSIEENRRAKERERERKGKGEEGRKRGKVAPFSALRNLFRDIESWKVALAAAAAESARSALLLCVTPLYCYRKQAVSKFLDM